MADTNEIRDFKLEEFVSVPEEKHSDLARQLLEFMEKSNCGDLSYILFEDDCGDGHKAIWCDNDTFNFQMSYCTTMLDQPISDSEAKAHMVAMLGDLIRCYNRDVYLRDENENDIVRWNCDAFDVCTYFLNPDPKPCENCQDEDDEDAPTHPEILVTDFDQSRGLFKELKYGFILKIDEKEPICLGVLCRGKIAEPNSYQMAKLSELNVVYRPEVEEVKENLVTLRFPITRYSELESSITLDLSKEEDVLKFADPMHVYNESLTNDERDRILDKYHSGEVDDLFKYIHGNLIDRSGPVKRYKLMGDCQFYEGLRRISADEYYINLGS